ncbi:MAG: UDP-N-acetylmuramoyl-L-alanine--D-glutamate ligase [Candidatus Omnitrophota bacterium]
MLDLKGKKVTILGFARSGREAAQLAAKHGAKIRISDQADTPQIRQAIEDCLFKDIAVQLGGHSERFIQDSDWVILSPGIRLDSPAVKWAAKKNIPVISEIELGFYFCPAKIIAITGSNGKTTVTTLVAEVLKKTGRQVFACGNIGNPFSGIVDKLASDDLVSLEVSSFQLETIVKFRPYVAVFLNFSRNHLDRHADMKEYLLQKRRIFMNQTADDWAVLNYEEPVVKGLAKDLKAKTVFFNSPSDKDNAISNPNFLAAQAVGEIFKVSQEDCLEVFDNFKGAEHRLEFVRNFQGVDYINDSKATTVESAVWALNQLDKPVIMICGGRDKGLDFASIRELVKARVKEMVIIGEAKEKLKKAFDGALPLKEAKDLKEAVSWAARLAQSGDCVLLCPMCASFDMFANFEERGRVFKDLVRRL